MGLKEVFINAGDAATKAFGNVQVPVIYETLGNTSYDIVTGKVSTGNNQHKIEVILVDFNSAEINGTDVLSTDKKALIAGKRISFEPKVDDIIMIDNKNWQVKGVASDPVGAIYTVHIRKP